MSLKENLLKNGIASILQKGVKIAEQLLLVPFFITAWGAAYYGEWLTLTIIPTIIGFSDLGFGTAASNAFVLKYASGDRQGAVDIAKSGFRAINLAVSVCIVLAISAMICLDYFNVFEKSLIDANDAVLAVSLLMAARILGFYQQLFDAYFRCARRVAVSINIQTLYSAVTIAIGLVVLLSKGGIVFFALSQLAVAGVFTFVHAMVALTMLPDIKLLKGSVKSEDIRTIVHKGFGFLLSPIWQAIFFQGTTFVVRIVLGPVAVTVFNTVRTLTRAVNQANAIVIGSTLPELQFEIGTGNFQKARKIFRFSLLLVSVISIVGMVLLYFIGPWFYELWTRKMLNPPALMWNLFLIGILFNAIWWISSDVLIAANMPYDFVVAGIFCSVISVAFTYVFAHYFGLTGAAIGSLLMDVVLFVYVLPRSCKLIDQPISTLLSGIAQDCVSYWTHITLKLYLKR